MKMKPISLGIKLAVVSMLAIGFATTSPIAFAKKTAEERAAIKAEKEAIKARRQEARGEHRAGGQSDHKHADSTGTIVEGAGGGDCGLPTGQPCPKPKP